MADRAYLERFSRELVDQGRLLEAGWVAMRLYVIHPDASAAQLEEMRMAFFAGAQHLFSSINTVLDEDAGPTEKDLERMTSIHNELQAFSQELQQHIDRRANMERRKPQ